MGFFRVGFQSGIWIAFRDEGVVMLLVVAHKER
jgi:hypothetical protein